MSEVGDIQLIEPSNRQEIDRWVAKYPSDQKQSAVLTALRLVQIQNKGSLTDELMNAVAAYLDMPAIAVYEVATFYSFYQLNPVGKHMINVCSNLPCFLRGADDIIAHLEKRLNIKAGETTKDGRYTLIKEVECLAACGNAPMMQIDNREYHEDLTPEKIDAILAEIDRGDNNNG